MLFNRRLYEKNHFIFLIIATFIGFAVGAAAFISRVLPAIKSGGVLWVPKNRVMKGANIPDPKEGAMKYMCKTAYPNKYNANSATLGLGELEYKLIETLIMIEPQML